jgi:hypothetical protein
VVVGVSWSIGGVAEERERGRNRLLSYGVPDSDRRVLLLGGVTGSSCDDAPRVDGGVEAWVSNKVGSMLLTTVSVSESSSSRLGATSPLISTTPSSSNRIATVFKYCKFMILQSRASAAGLLTPRKAMIFFGT